ncbi:hypothetical protein HHI36_005674 [Cryptolaemus montrouzieri]|uniref:DNA polymerase alpha catalytic subunit N-terminal domain-containing protein n=1 Tax=Cryptolaemus montrouzieri TaxID=559131 RepID=A0ABD2NVT5_9CUCU
MSDSDERRPKRQKRESSYKAKAFEKFKQIKSGSRNKYEVEEIDNVYETVDEKEYLKKVLDRQDDDWVVDDDGSGYYDDGREIFDDDLDHESIANASSSKTKGTKRKKKAVSDNVPKSDLKLMISKMPAKRKEEEKVSEDAMLSELLGEMDETDQNQTNNHSLKSLLSNKKAEIDYLKTFTPPPRKLVLKKKLLERKSLPSKPKSSLKFTNDEYIETKEYDNIAEVQQNDDDKENKKEDNSEDYAIDDQNSEKIEELPPNSEIKESENTTIDFDDTEKFFDDDMDFSQIEELESQHNETVDIETAEDNILSEFMDHQESFHSSESETNKAIHIDSSDLPLMEIENKKVFRFFYWDAYENAFVQPGVVFLFGKTFCEKTKTYASCSVVVKDVQRKLFILPRSHFLDEFGNPTDQLVSHKDVYEEFNNKVMKPLHITCFKCRFISKKIVLHQMFLLSLTTWKLDILPKIPRYHFWREKLFLMYLG